MPNFKLRTSNFKYYLASNKGSAMVLALTISILLFILMVTGVLLIRQQTKLISGSRGKSAALGVAEAGLDSGIWRLERNQTLPFDADNKYTFTGSNTQGTFSVEVKMINDTKFEITSTGTKAASNEKRAVKEDVYYINLSRSIATLSSANGGGQIEGNVNIWGPFYTSGDLSLGGTASVANLVGTSGNPFLVGGNLSLSGNATVGSASSPMSVFVGGNISPASPPGPVKVFTKVSNIVPDVSLPDVVKTQYLNAAEANDNAIWTGALTLGGDPRSFSHFNYSGGTSPTLTVEGVIYIKGNLTIDTANRSVSYLHATGKQATIFVEGTITIDDELKAASGYPADSVLALVNEDQNPGIQTDDDIYISVGPGKLVQAFIYSSGRLRITRQATIEGSLIAKILYLDNVPDLKAPSVAVQNNYPALFPAKDLAILTSANWREVAP